MKSYAYDVGYKDGANAGYALAKDEIEALGKQLAEIKSVVNRQTEDEGLWFRAETIFEAYLQKELRRLHYIIEKELEK